MSINEKKLARQLIGVERWRKSSEYGSYRNGVGTLNYYTGVGKTYTAILAIKKFLAKFEDGVVYVVVPSEALYKQWLKEIAKHCPEHKDSIKVCTAQKLIQMRVRITVGLLIVDEVDKFLGDEWFKVLNGTYFSFKYLLCLTATFDDKQNRLHKLQAIAPVIDRISEEEALREGYISQFIEFNLATPLTEEELLTYRLHSDTINKNLAKFGKFGFKGANLVLQGDKDYSPMAYAMMWAKKNGWNKDLDLNIQVNADINNLWNPYKIIGYAKNALQAVKFRKDLLYNSENKLATTIQLLKMFQGKKTICFSQSTIFADKVFYLANRIFGEGSCVVYHSNVSSSKLSDSSGNIITYKSGSKKGQPKMFGKKTLREHAIKEISNGKAWVISTASSLDTGFDVESIEFGITTSGTSTPTQHKQRNGRVKRRKTYKEDTIVVIVNLYVPNTKDEEWLNTRQAKESHSINWISSIEEIRFPNTDNSSDFLIQ